MPNKKTEDFNKVKKTIVSVENTMQLKAAIKVINNFIVLHKIKESSPEYKYLLKMVNLQKLIHGVRKRKPSRDLDNNSSEDLSEQMKLKRIIREVLNKYIETEEDLSEEEELDEEDESMWGNDENWGTDKSYWKNDPKWGSSTGGYGGDSGSGESE